MALVSRAHVIDKPEGKVWRMFETESKREWAFAVDDITGTYRERNAWMIEQKISKRTYAHMNNLICFFKKEEDAVLYYLKWGRYGNS